MTLQLVVRPINQDFSLKGHIYDVLKQGIMAMNIYAKDAELRLDERQLSEQLQISRTPIREALARLEQEGLVRIAPRKGVFILRKSVGEILEMIIAWAALESMAARLATERAGDAEIALAAPHAGKLRPGRGAHPHRRVFRGQHQVSPAHSRDLEMRDPEGHGRRSVPSHAGHPRPAR